MVLTAVVGLSGCTPAPTRSSTTSAQTSTLPNAGMKPAPRQKAATAFTSVVTPGIRVTGSVDRDELSSVLDAARAARSWVERTWPRQTAEAGEVKIQVASNPAQFAQLRGGAPTSPDVVASTTPTGLIVLSRQALGMLNVQGRRVILAHEITHVVLQQTKRAGLPHWVVEGSAEFTAYRFAGVSLAESIRLLTAVVRAGNTPSAPPGNGSFSTNSSQSAYQQAHGYTAFLVDRYGMSAWRQFVVATDNGSETAFADFFSGASVETLRVAYTAFLRSRIG